MKFEVSEWTEWSFRRIQEMCVEFDWTLGMRVYRMYLRQMLLYQMLFLLEQK